MVVYFTMAACPIEPRIAPSAAAIATEAASRGKRPDCGRAARATIGDVAAKLRSAGGSEASIFSASTGRGPAAGNSELAGLAASTDASDLVAGPAEASGAAAGVS